MVASLKKPVNVVMSAFDPALHVKDLEALGVRRISVGGAMSRVALAAFLKSARDLKEHGSFAWLRDAIPTRDLVPMFRD